MARSPGSLNAGSTSDQTKTFLDNHPGWFFTSNELPGYLGIPASDTGRLNAALCFLKKNKLIACYPAAGGQSKFLYGSMLPGPPGGVGKPTPMPMKAVPAPAPAPKPNLTLADMDAIEREINIRAEVLAKAKIDSLTAKLQAAINRFGAEVNAEMYLETAIGFIERHVPTGSLMTRHLVPVAPAISVAEMTADLNALRAGQPPAPPHDQAHGPSRAEPKPAWLWPRKSSPAASLDAQE